MTRVIRRGRFQGTWEKQRTDIADLKIGDIITVPGVGCWTPLVDIDHQSDGRTRIVYDYQVGAVPRRAVRYRQTSGKTTINVRTGEAS